LTAEDRFTKLAGLTAVTLCITCVAQVVKGFICETANKFHRPMAILLQCLTFHNALLVFHQFHAFHTSIGNNFCLALQKTGTTAKILRNHNLMSELVASLRVDHVTKRYGDFTAVDDLSFEVRPGRVFGFLGPNGAGKTTTIRMIVGITAPDEGSVELFGRHISSDLQDKIGYLPEERGLYKKLKIVDQLRYFAALKDVPTAEADKKINDMLNAAG